MHIYISKSQQTYLYYSGGAEAIIIESSARVPLNKMFGEIRNDFIYGCMIERKFQAQYQRWKSKQSKG